MDFPYGEIETDIPKDFVPPELWPEYGYFAGIAAWCRKEKLDANVPGLRWSLWPLCFEEYIGDYEPDIAASSKLGTLAYNRLVTWKRLHRADVPRGWFIMSRKPARVDGFIALQDDTVATWRKKTRRDLRRWQELHNGITHTIEEVTLDEYLGAYKKSIVVKRGGAERLQILQQKFALPEVAANAKLWGVRDLTTHELVAGSAVVFSSTYSASAHFAPFTRTEALPVFASTALMHHWFKEARLRGLRYAVTTNFWYRGKPRAWKGFSEFKSHFGFKYIAYPPELIRFARGKLF